MESNKFKETAKVPHLVPEASYDILARLIPGAVAVGCVLWFFNKDIVSKNINALVYLLLIMVSYIVGFSVDSVLNRFLQGRMIKYSWRVIVDSFSDVDELRKMATFLGSEIPLSASSNVKQKNALWKFVEKLRKKKTLKKINYEKKKRIAEKLREHVVTNHPYATWMMPKLNGEAALPRNLGVCLIIPFLIIVYDKLSPELYKEYVSYLTNIQWLSGLNLQRSEILSCEETLGWNELVKLLPLWLGIEVALVFTRTFRLRRAVTRTVFWFQELERQKTKVAIPF